MKLLILSIITASLAFIYVNSGNYVPEHELKEIERQIDIEDRCAYMHHNWEFENLQALLDYGCDYEKTKTKSRYY